MQANTEKFSLPATMAESRTSLDNIYLISKVNIEWEELLIPHSAKELLFVVPH